MSTNKDAMSIEQIRERSTLTVPEAGRVLGLGRDAAYDAARRGTLPVLKLNARRLVVPVPALLRLLGAEAARFGPGGQEPSNG